MLREFGRLAFGPLIVAAIIGAVIAWLTRSFDGPPRSVSSGGAGEIGGSIGAAGSTVHARRYGVCLNKVPNR